MAEWRCALARRFAALASAAPEAPALIGAGGEVLADRARLADEAVRLVELLAPWVRPDEPVVLSLPNSRAFIASFLALRSQGVPVALVDATAPGEELLRCADTVGATRLLTGNQRFARERVLAATEDIAVVGHAPARRVTLPARTAVLKLTSGSTGVPRAVAVSVRHLAADTVQLMRTMGFGGNDVTLAAIPLTHSYGIGSCLVPLVLAGTPLVLVGVQLPAALATALAAAGVAHFPAVPAMIRALTALEHLPALSRLRVCLSAGAPLAPNDAAAFHAVTGHKVHVFYGSSECGGITYDRSDQAFLPPGVVGTAVERVRVEILGEDGTAAGPGQPGRVAVHSRAVALASVPPPANQDELRPGRFLTGDLGLVDDLGRLTLTGRLADTLNVAGKKVHPEEVRAVLETAPGVREAAVVGLADPHRGQLVAAMIVAERGAVVEVPALLSWCRARLAPHKVPRRLLVVDTLPLTERGKLDREAIQRLLAPTPGPDTR